MQNYNEKIDDNLKIKEINTGYDIADEQLNFMVDQIINKKKEENVNDIINNFNENDLGINNNVSNNNEKIEGIDYEIEKKVNQILSEQRMKKIKNNI